jgi:hypothetical protein
VLFPQCQETPGDKIQHLNKTMLPGNFFNLTGNFKGKAGYQE